MSSAEQIRQHFAAAGGWEARARLLMQYGEQLPSLPEALRDDAHRVHGCASAVWLDGESQEGLWQFRAASEARLLRGLLALLLLRVNGLPGSALDQLDVPAWFAELGLSRQLSPSRSNGLNAVLGRMRELVQRG